MGRHRRGVRDGTGPYSGSFQAARGNGRGRRGGPYPGCPRIERRGDSDYGSRDQRRN